MKVFLNDMSFVNEIAFQTWGQNNWTFYIYGDSRIRTVFPGPEFYVRTLRYCALLFYLFPFRGLMGM